MVYFLEWSWAPPMHPSSAKSSKGSGELCHALVSPDQELDQCSSPSIWTSTPALASPLASPPPQFSTNSRTHQNKTIIHAQRHTYTYMNTLLWKERELNLNFFSGIRFFWACGGWTLSFRRCFSCECFWGRWNRDILISSKGFVPLVNNGTRM